MQKTQKRPRPSGPELTAARVAHVARESRDPKERLKYLEHERLAEFVPALVNYATRHQRASEQRRNVLTILSNFSTASPRVVEVLGWYPNSLIKESLGLEFQRDDMYKFYEESGTLHALHLITTMTTCARYKLLKSMESSKWASLLVNLSKALLSDAPAPLRSPFALSLGHAAIYALSCFATLPPNPDCAAQVDPKDPTLRHLRQIAVIEMLNAGVPAQVNALVENAFREILCNGVIAGASSKTVAGEWEAPLTLRGMYALAGSTNAERAVIRAIEVECQQTPSLSSNLIALLEHSFHRATKSTAMHCLTLIHEEMPSKDIRKGILGSKLPRLLVREVGIGDSGESFNSIISYSHAAFVCFYYLFYIHGVEAIRVLKDLGGVGVVLTRFRRTLDAVGAQIAQEPVQESGATSTPWSAQTQHELLHLIFYILCFLRNAALVSTKSCDEMLQADILGMLWSIEDIFARSHLRNELKKVADETIESFRTVGGSLYLTKLMERKAAKNDRVLQERDDRSQNLANIRRQLAGAPRDVSLPERPEQHYCSISHEVMVDPVMASDGHAYERVHIERWLQEHDTSPLTNAKLTNVELLLPAHALRTLIEQWDEQMHEYSLDVYKRCAEPPMSDVEMADSFVSYPPDIPLIPATRAPSQEV
tara:strand:- start:483 stop:2438 length:1956 start_codon:yes stop_codon:yes gene_type:complete